MKISKRQLRRIIKEEKAKLFETIHEETIDMGGEAWTRGDFLDAISDYSKELTGRRDRAAVEKLANAPIEEIAAYYSSMSTEAQQHPEFIYATDVKSAESQRNVRDAIDAYKPMPKQQGMGRRTESITKRQLRKIIRENMEHWIPLPSPEMQAADENIAQVATELISNPASATTLLDEFPPAIELRSYLETMEGGRRIDSFLDKIEDDLKAQGVDRVSAIKFADSFMNFR